MTMDQSAKAVAFRELHRGPEALLIFNIWDVVSAQAVAPHVRAIATSSWAVAAAQGYADGQHMPLELLEQLIRRIVNTVDLPVSVDFEAGYGATPEQAADSVERILRAGVVGINLEDGLVDGRRELAPARAHAAKITAIRKRADALGLPLFINARTDSFLLKAGDALTCFAETERRARLYSDAGADGLFVPGLADLDAIAVLARVMPLPLNIMVVDGSPDPAAVAKAGARRISLAMSPQTSAMRALAAHAVGLVGHLRNAATFIP